jgi:transcriptional regulator with XRE-family HTH domain
MAQPKHIWPRPAWIAGAEKIRRAKKIRYSYLAKRMGISDGAVGHWFHARRDPNVTHLEQVAKLMGVPVARFWDDFEKTSPQEEKIRELVAAAPPAIALKALEAALALLSALNTKEEQKEPAAPPPDLDPRLADMQFYRPKRGRPRKPPMNVTKLRQK